MKVTGLKKLHKLRDTEPGIGNQRPHKTLPKLPMLRNRNTTLEPSFFSMTWLPRCRSTTRQARTLGHEPTIFVLFEGHKEFLRLCHSTNRSAILPGCQVLAYDGCAAVGQRLSPISSRTRRRPH